MSSPAGQRLYLQTAGRNMTMISSGAHDRPPAPGDHHPELVHLAGRTSEEAMTTNALPPVVDAGTWQRQLDALRAREKAATRELDAIATLRRRMPMVKMPDYTLEGEEGPVRLADIFGGRSQLIVYNHMWFPAEQWQCPGCTGFTSQFTRLEFLDSYDARFVIVTQGPIDEALAYKRRVGNMMTWYSTANSPFGSDVGAPPGGGFAVNVFLRDGDIVYRTWHTNGRGTEQLSHSFALIDLLPYGRQEEWQDSPEGWPRSPTYSRWARLAGHRRALRPGCVSPPSLRTSSHDQSTGVAWQLSGEPGHNAHRVRAGCASGRSGSRGGTGTFHYYDGGC